MYMDLHKALSASFVVDELFTNVTCALINDIVLCRKRLNLFRQK